MKEENEIRKKLQDTIGLIGVQLLSDEDEKKRQMIIDTLKWVLDEKT